nr:FtsX-like permease family protein [uncultured Acetatifactor sp.]
MEERLGSDLNMTIDISSVIEGSAGVYVSLMTVIVVGILVLGVAVIAFVLYLLVRLSLGRRKREYGILKALGFTTGQLVLQTAASFLPAVLLSTVIGIAVSAAIINPVVALFLGGIGIVKCTFTVPLGWTILSGAGLVLTAFGLACLLSLRIRKIAPVALLAGE